MDSAPDLQITSRLPSAGTTIFTVMSALAAEHNAVNLGQGFPDYPIDPVLAGLVAKAMADGHNQYPLMAGILPLREAIAAKVERCYGRNYDPVREVTVTSGATEAIWASVSGLVHPGDEVILFEPVYDSYGPAITLAGGKIVSLPLTFPGFRIDWAAVRAAVTPRTRMIMVNFPNNPSGSILAPADLEELAAITRGTKIVVVSDEVYEHMVYDGRAHQSIARHAELAARGVVIGSFGKTFHATGWKIGYACAPREITDEIRRVHQFIVFTVSSPMQHGIAAFLADPSRYEGLAAFFQKKRDLFRELMDGTPFDFLPAEGAYFQLATYAKISDEPDAQFATRLVKEHGVATIPLSAFYATPPAQKVIRFCFAKKDETLRAAAERLRKLR
jgi:methionine aminotransferase